MPIRRLSLLAAAAALCGSAAAQESTHVRLATPAPAAVAGLLEPLGFDVVEGSVGARALELVVDASDRAWLERRGFALETLSVGRPFRDIERERAAAAGGDFVPGYPTLAQIQADLAAFAAAAPGICQLVDLTATYGTPPTFEGRSLFAVKISDNVSLEEDEPTALLVAAHHCREVVTPVIALRAVELLTTLYGSDPAVTAVVDANEIWIAPVWNPDGYEYVFTTNNLWRKNRRVFPSDVGVDLNRNYPFGWSAPCGGSTSSSSSTYRGPSAASEAETLTMQAWMADRWFAKVADYHSYASEVRYGNGCWAYPNGSWWQSLCAQMSAASGYGGATAQSCCLGGDIHMHYATTGALTFLLETHTQFQPPFASAQTEADKVWPGFLWLLQQPLPLSGHVTDACSGLPVVADVEVSTIAFAHGETNASGGDFGRYQAFAPAGPATVTFSAPGYAPLQQAVTLLAGAGVVLDVQLQPLGNATTYCAAKTNSLGCVPAVAGQGTPSVSAGSGFLVTCANVRNQKAGTLFYGVSGRASLPFQGGTLCVAPAVRRTPVVSSGGQPLPAQDCSGVYALDFNAFRSGALGGNPHPALAQPGAVVDAQWWGRDQGFPPPLNSTLSDALEFTLCL